MGRLLTACWLPATPTCVFSFRAGEGRELWGDEHRQHARLQLTLPGARMKLVGEDSGRVEQEEVVEQVALAPSERVVVDVLVESPGELALEHHTPNGLTGSPRSP